MELLVKARPIIIIFLIYSFFKVQMFFALRRHLRELEVRVKSEAGLPFPVDEGELPGKPEPKPKMTEPVADGK